jgi:hypothetical protein
MLIRFCPPMAVDSQWAWGVFYYLLQFVVRIFYYGRPLTKLRMMWIRNTLCQPKVKTVTLQTWTDPEGTMRLRLPDFENRHTKILKLSAPRNGCLYPPGNIPVTPKLSRSQVHRVAGRVVSTKHPNQTIGNRTCYVPACSPMLQPTAPSHDPPLD